MKADLIYKKKCICLLWCGSILMLLGVTVLACFSSVYETMIDKALIMSPDSEAFGAWRKTAEPLTFNIYLFNWTNPEDIYNPAIKPHFQEVGPYMFKLTKEKVNITWNDNNTMTYLNAKTFHFDEKNSPHGMSDVLTTINTVAVTTAYQLRDWNYVFRSGLSIALSTTSNISVTKTAGQLLFEGYDDPFLAILQTATILATKSVDDRFGFFYEKNATAGLDGVYNIETNGGPEFGKALNWNYEKSTTYFDGHCGKVAGSAGELYPKDRTRDYISLFSPDMCRSVELDYESTVNVKNVEGYKYTAGPAMFDNGTYKPENDCYCNEDCLNAGVLNISRCRDNAPIFLSQPHFYNADPSFNEDVEGLHPEKDKHEFFFTLEPKTGVILSLAARMQVNVLLQPDSAFGLFSDVPKVLIPVFWFDQSITAADELTSLLGLLQRVPDICKYSAIALCIVGSLLIGFVVIYVVFHNNKKHVDSKLHFEEVPLRS